VGSIDRPVRPDQPDPPDRPDRSERPKTPQDFDAKLAERLSTLTRASAYERLYARAQAQDAPFRERLAREESAEPKDSLSADKPDKPERDLERPRTYWTEAPRFLALWQKIADHWPARKKHESDSSPQSPDRRAEALLASEKISQGEPPISEKVRRIEQENSSKAWLVGFDFRLKQTERLAAKVAERLKREPERKPQDIASTVHDAIRYTFCLENDSYESGYSEIKGQLESCGYEMYHCHNSWADPQYKGINTRWATSEGQRFEVQFHTRESFHAKHEVTHLAYERLRQPGASTAERRDLMEFQREVSRWIPIPDRARDISNYEKKVL